MSSRASISARALNPSITSIFIDNSVRNLQEVSRSLEEVYTIQVDNDRHNSVADTVSLDRDNLENISKIKEYYNFKLEESDPFKKYLDSLDDGELKDFFFGEIPNEGISKEHFDEIDRIFNSRNQSNINFLFIDMDKTLTNRKII